MTGHVTLNVEHINIVLDYHSTKGVVKCKLFALSLKGFVMTWFQNLSDGSSESWKAPCEEFASHFTAANVNRRRWLHSAPSSKERWNV
ncbi:hypothetical protein A2U01_0013885 [Trifolium medium]|uniref:Retrotransposon gag domain-containing protein n=1 Tax=Trifolium medium TaxID=97028 RepID=A0A392N174_9FABA|nr:hypothetical protein [Trifolium medium]